MRDLIEKAERAVARAREWPTTSAQASQVKQDRLVAEAILFNLSLHPDFFRALKLFADLKDGEDGELFERISEAISDSIDMDWRPKDGARAIMQELTK